MSILNLRLQINALIEAVYKQVLRSRVVGRLSGNYPKIGTHKRPSARAFCRTECIRRIP
jgi:hypothetical protein